VWLLGRVGVQRAQWNAMVAKASTYLEYATMRF
jgi:hypothetical protein